MSGTRRYRFGPLEDRGVVGPLRMGQVLVVGAAALLALGALYVLRSWAGMIVALLVLGAGGALIYLPFEGRTLEEWAPVGLRWALRPKHRKRGYRSASPQGGAAVERRRDRLRVIAAGGARGTGDAGGRPTAPTRSACCATRGRAPTPPRSRCGPAPSPCSTPASRSESSTAGGRSSPAWPATAARSAGCNGSSGRCRHRAMSSPPTSSASATARSPWTPAWSPPTSSWWSRRHRSPANTRSCWRSRSRSGARPGRCAGSGAARRRRASCSCGRPRTWPSSSRSPR